MGAGSRHEAPRSGPKDFTTHSRASSLSVMWVSGGLALGGLVQMGSERGLHIWRAASQEGNMELREPKSFMMGRKYACPLLWREMLFLSFKAVHYINILEKVFGNHGQSVPAHKMYRHVRHMESCLLTEEMSSRWTLLKLVIKHLS